MKTGLKKGLLIAAFLLTSAGGAARADKALLQSCPGVYGGNMYADVQVPTPPGTYYINGPAFPTGSVGKCRDYTWFRANTNYAQPIWFSVRHVWNGPKLTNADACSHSKIEYGVFSAIGGPAPNAIINWVGGGEMWGKVGTNGSCGYSVTNWPATSWGTNDVRVSGSRLTEYWIGVKQWSHNHDGNQCADPIGCSWKPRLRIGKEPY